MYLLFILFFTFYNNKNILIEHYPYTQVMDALYLSIKENNKQKTINQKLSLATYYFVTPVVTINIVYLPDDYFLKFHINYTIPKSAGVVLIIIFCIIYNT